MSDQPKHKSIQRATKATLALHRASFSLDGLRFHYSKLRQYTNLTGGALNKIPINTKAHTSAYFSQFEQHASIGQSPWGPPAPWDSPPQPTRKIYLSKKAQYQVADHLLGIGQKAYWTGSTGQSTLLGLDIDDHHSKDNAEVQANSELALQLFVELTGLNPVPCKSPRGINAFLICHKNGVTTQFTNETWHSVVRLVNAEASHRGLAAKMECKGKARIFNAKVEYCGVQFKDPFYAANPTDDELHAFWDELEKQALTGADLLGLLTTLENENYCADLGASQASNKATPSSASVKSQNVFLPTYRGSWAKQCHEWAVNGLPCDDSIATVVAELAKWLFFVELTEVAEPDRVPVVADLLFDFCLAKHNGHVTRLNLGQVDEVKAQIQRIVNSTVSRISQKGKDIFAKLQSQQHMKLVPLMKSTSLSSSFLSVKSIECLTVSGWLPAPEYRRQRAEQWVYVPNDTPLPEGLRSAILRFYKKEGLRMYRPTLVKLGRFLNHLWSSPGHEAHLGVESLRSKMGFGNDARAHLKHLEQMGVIDAQGYCPVAGVSKLFRIRQPAFKYFEERQTESVES